MNKRTKFISIGFIVGLLTLLLVSPAGATPTAISVEANGVANATFVSNAGGSTGTVQVSVSDAASNADATAVDTITIQVINATRNKTVNVTLSETVSASDFNLSDNTGIFGKTNAFIVDAVADEDLTATPPVMGANDGDTIQVVAQPLVRQMTVDGKGPVVASLSPADDTITRAQAITFTGTITDARSGIKSTGSPAQPASGQITINIDDVDRTNFVTFTATTAGDGFTFNLVQFLSAGTHTWQVIAKDKSGNITTSDSDADTSGNQKNDLEIDTVAPALDSAVTGESWDATNGVIKANVRNSIHLTFSGDKLNVATLSPTDFLVGDPGVSPTAIVFPNLKAGASGNNSGLDLRDDVFLTLASDQLPNAKPLVRVVGSIEDLATNPSTTGQVTASDGIAPKLTVSVTGEASSRGVSVKEVSVRVVSDETISAGVLPVITVNRLKADSGTPQGVTNVSASAVATTEQVVSGLANTWEAKVKLTDVQSIEGLYHAKATILDAAGNEGTGGESTTCTTDGCVDLGKAALFEFDDEINNGSAPTFTLTPNQGTGKETKTESASPFIRIDLNAEGNEYRTDFADPLDKIKGVADPTVETEIDSHNGVTLTVVKLDGVDVSASVGTVDANSFLLSTSGLAVGSHTLEVNAQDDVANKYSANQKFTFSVVTRALFKIDLVPGTNFISLPGEPADPRLDTVLAGTDAVEVLSYQGGVWLTATKDATGSFVGTLTGMDATHAYLVKTTSFAPIQVDIPQRLVNTVPPTISLTAGWNMVPVVDLSLRPAGTTFEEDDYFGSLGTKWKIAYTFNTTENVWEKLLPAGTVENVATGKGYWVWLSEAAELVP